MQATRWKMSTASKPPGRPEASVWTERCRAGSLLHAGLGAEHLDQPHALQRDHRDGVLSRADVVDSERDLAPAVLGESPFPQRRVASMAIAVDVGRGVLRAVAHHVVAALATEQTVKLLLTPRLNVRGTCS